MAIQFENTRNLTQATRWYSVEGAPTIKYKQWTLSPCSAIFQFTDGKFVMVTVRGCVVLKNGALSERFMEIPTIHLWNPEKWPSWLLRLRDFAFSEFAHNTPVDGNKIPYEEEVSVS